MIKTPKYFLELLNQVTAESMPRAESLTGMRALHVKRVRSVFDDPNIIGAGIADKLTEKKTTDTMSLVFYVRKKLPKSKIDPNLMVPPVIAGAGDRAVFTDVFEMGEVRPQVNKTRRPLKSGFSVGLRDVATGTLGAIVKRADNFYILSNAHVLASSGLGKKGDHIVYPGTDDGGKTTDEVATLRFFKPFKAGGSFVNTYDAALAQVGSQHLDDIDWKILAATTPLRIADPVRGMKVIKRGRTSGDTESVVRDIDFRIQVQYDGLGVIGFTGQVRCDTYTRPGDSGSIVVAKDSGAIVGLHFAGSPSGSVFTPIRTVMEGLQFKFHMKRT